MTMNMNTGGRLLFFVVVGALGSLALGCNRTNRTMAAVSGATHGAKRIDTNSFAIVGATVFDGTKFIGTPTVVVASGEIEFVGKAELGPNVKQIDGRGKTLLPGLIDAHAHVHERQNLTDAITFGTTTVLDMGCAPIALVSELRQLATDNVQLADVRGAGYGVTSPGGHCTEYGMWHPTVTGASEATALVAKNAADGSDYIKIIVESGEIVGHSRPTLSVDTLRAAINAAHQNARLAVVHVGTVAEATMALAAGADVLAHAPSDQATNVTWPSQKAVIATLSVLASVAGDSRVSLHNDPRLAPMLSPQAIANLKRLYALPTAKVSMAHTAATLRAMRDADMVILAGTDAPNQGTWYGVSLLGELERLTQAGLATEHALAAATSAPADVFALTDRGRIQPGRRADLLLVDGDATQDIAALRAIVTVWRGGNEIKRADVPDVTQATKLSHPAKSAAPQPQAFATFDDGVPANWAASTDTMAGGTSVATLSIVQPTADRSAALSVVGTVVTRPGGSPWAGAQFYPAGAFRPIDLSHTSGIRFKGRSDGKPIALVVFTQSGGMKPFIAPLALTAHWSEQTVTWKQLGLVPTDVVLMAFTTHVPGEFSFALDDVSWF